MLNQSISNLTMSLFSFVHIFTSWSSILPHASVSDSKDFSPTAAFHGAVQCYSHPLPLRNCCHLTSSLWKRNTTSWGSCSDLRTCRTWKINETGWYFELLSRWGGNFTSGFMILSPRDREARVFIGRHLTGKLINKKPFTDKVVWGYGQ